MSGQQTMQPISTSSSATGSPAVRPAPEAEPGMPPLEEEDEKVRGGSGGDVIILDNLPAVFTIGCDHVSLSTTTTPFRGVRGVPPGPHLVWVAPTDSTSSRSGFWFVTDGSGGGPRPAIHAWRWDAFNEVLVGGVDGAAQCDGESRNMRRRLAQILPALAPYRFPASGSASANRRQEEADLLPPFIQDKASMWSYLTSAITPQLLDSIIGDRRRTERTTAGVSWPVTSSDRVLGESRTPEEARLYSSGIGSSGGGGGDSSESSPPLRFMFRMDEQLFDTAAEGAERTRQALDPTGWILGMLDKEEGPSSKPTLSASSVATPSSNPSPGDDSAPAGQLIGELQLAFLTGAHLGNFSCLEQWHFALGRVALRAYGLADERPRLARDVLRILHAQLAYADLFLDSGGDILEELVPERGRGSSHGHARGGLRKALTTYRARLEERKKLTGAGDGGGEGLREVADAFGDLEAYLARGRGWDLRADAYLRSGDLMLEDGEVVHVELDEFADEDERGEFAPVVVGLDDLGRQTDLVSWDR